MIFNHEIKSAEEEMSYSLCSKTGFPPGPADKV